MKSKFSILITTSLALIALDLVTKFYIHSSFQLSESVTVIPNFFSFTYVRNFGAAFGFLAQSHEEFRKVFFAIMPPFACLIIFLILRKVPDNNRIKIYALSSIMGGALANYINRMYLGYVVDFFDLHFYSKYTWPTFNIADIAIVCGVGILLSRLKTETE